MAAQDARETEALEEEEEHESQVDTQSLEYTATLSNPTRDMSRTQSFRVTSTMTTPTARRAASLYQANESSVPSSFSRGDSVRSLPQPQINRRFNRKMMNLRNSERSLMSANSRSSIEMEEETSLRLAAELAEEEMVLLAMEQSLTDVSTMEDNLVESGRSPRTYARNPRRSPEGPRVETRKITVERVPLEVAAPRIHGHADPGVPVPGTRDTSRRLEMERDLSDRSIAEIMEPDSPVLRSPQTHTSSPAPGARPGTAVSISGPAPQHPLLQNRASPRLSPNQQRTSGRRIETSPRLMDTSESPRTMLHQQPRPLPGRRMDISPHLLDTESPRSMAQQQPRPLLGRRMEASPRASETRPGVQYLDSPPLTKSPEVRAAIVAHVSQPLDVSNRSVEAQPKDPNTQQQQKPASAWNTASRVATATTERLQSPGSSREWPKLGEEEAPESKPAGVDVSEQELLDIQRAIEESESALQPPAPMYDLSGAEDHMTEEELREIQKALGDVALSASPSPTPGPSNAISEEDSAAIAKAIQESEEEAARLAALERQEKEEEERQSFRLAMQIQQEETEMHRGSLRTRQEGNVRTMSRMEFETQKMSAKLANAANTRDSGYYGDEEFDEEYYNDEVAAGFRLNAASPHQWNRVGQNVVTGPNNEVRTKHDPLLQGQANAHRLGLDTEEISTVNNQAYNSFMKSMKGNKKGVAMKGSGRAGSDADGTKGGAMDPTVRSLISKAINSQLIEKCNGVVKEGKEAIIYHADMGSESEGFDVAIKVFKRIQEFRGRGEYVDGDPRYSRSAFKNSSVREQLELWAEKEFRNLMRANKADVPVPTPLLLKENIVFMRFLGEDGWPAPQLREIHNIRQGSRRWGILYEQVLEAMRRLYIDARLVHADLSEYNILVVPSENVENALGDADDELQIVLIDFGQSVDTKHPMALELLRRDVDRVSAFFRRQAVNILSVDEMMTHILGETNT